MSTQADLGSLTQVFPTFSTLGPTAAILSGGGFTSQLPMGPSGSPFMGATLPDVSGSGEIGIQERNASMSTNEKPVVYHLWAKSWTPTGPTQTYGDKLINAPHHIQLLPGDLVFVNENHSSNSSSSGTQHRVICAELAKLNETLAVAYNEIKKSFDEKGVGLSDGYTRTTAHLPSSRSGGSVSGSGVHTHGITYRSILENIYTILKPDLENPLASLTITDVLKDYRELINRKQSPIIGGGGAFVPPPEEDEYEEEALFATSSKKSTTRGGSLSSSRRNFLPIPHNQNIYKKFFQNYPEKHRYGNSLELLPTTKEFEAFNSDFEKNERKKINVLMQFLMDESENEKINPKKDDFTDAQMIAIQTCFHAAITELLATSEKYITNMTLSGCINFWKFYGIVKSGGEGISPTLAFHGPKTEATSLVNYYIDKFGPTTNRWGRDLPAGTTVWIIVKKLKPDGPYQFVPWHDKSKGMNGNGGRPAPSDLEYFDEDGMTKCVGAAIKIGRVKINFADSHAEDSRNIANGICEDRFPIPFNRALEEKRNIGSTKKVELALGNN